MDNISINNQEDLDDVVNDTAVDGKYIIFYEMLQKSLSMYSEKRINDMKNTLRYAMSKYSLDTIGNRDIEELSTMEIIYWYSLLP